MKLSLRADIYIIYIILMLLQGEENWGQLPSSPKRFPKNFKDIVLYS